MFIDRADAGRQLGERLRHLRSEPVVVLGLPRGGVPVAYEVAKALDAPLDVIVVRKLGVPFQPELAMGAIGEGGIRILDDEVMRSTGVSKRDLDAVEVRERAELERRAERFRGTRKRVPLRGRTAIVVDDGIATGSTARAACRVARAEGAARVVLAVPVAPPGWRDRIGQDADELVCVASPTLFFAIGQFYVDFSQTTDEEVLACLEAAGRREPATVAPSADAGDVDPAPVAQEVEVRIGDLRLGGLLSVPERPVGMVVFAHGSGSSRHSPRNRFVAAVLNQASLGTLLFDLLTAGEEQDRGNVFDIGLLGRRLVDVRRWLRARSDVGELPVGYFGASTGAAAALWAAAEPAGDVRAVVSRGGRPDLAAARLAEVSAPTLLIVGGSDDVVLELNRRAASQLRCEHRVVVVPGATHLFEEPGTLQSAAELARDWFTLHLAAQSQVSVS